MPRRPRVLFVSHDASRTGSPIVLLTLQRWLRANVDIEIQTLLLEGGPLQSDFASVGGVHLFDDVNQASHGRGVIDRLTRRLSPMPDGMENVAQGLARLEWRARSAISARQSERTRRRMAELGPWDLVYLNSTGSSRVLEFLPETLPIVTHIHEMLSQPNNQLWIRYETKRLAELARRSRSFIAVSEAARRSVVDELHLAPDHVALCREFIDCSAIRSDPVGAAAARAELDLPAGAFVVGGSGTTEWRKGPDLFVQAAIAARSRGLNQVKFLWVGADGERLQTLEQLFDIERADLRDSVRFLEVQPDPQPYFSLFDVFALTSRSDPFPLVALEAAARGTPIICFEGGGGMQEFVQDGAGVVLPYADAGAVAETVGHLIDDPERALSLGRRAAEKARAENDVRIVAPQIWAVMQAAMAGVSAAGSTADR